MCIGGVLSVLIECGLWWLNVECEVCWSSVKCVGGVLSVLVECGDGVEDGRGMLRCNVCGE